MRETTALGAAIAAGLAVGVWDTLDALKDINVAGRTEFKPGISRDEAAQRSGRWQKAVHMSSGWL